MAEWVRGSLRLVTDYGEGLSTFFQKDFSNPLRLLLTQFARLL